MPHFATAQTAENGKKDRENALPLRRPGAGKKPGRLSHPFSANLIAFFFYQCYNFI